MRTELSAHFDSAQSFYGKAMVEGVKLYSYNTLVAEIKKGKVIIHNTHSAITLRHIKEFLRQNGFPADTKKQILEAYV